MDSRLHPVTSLVRNPRATALGPVPWWGFGCLKLSSGWWVHSVARRMPSPVVPAPVRGPRAHHTRSQFRARIALARKSPDAGGRVETGLLQPLVLGSASPSGSRLPEERSQVASEVECRPSPECESVGSSGHQRSRGICSVSEPCPRQFARDAYCVGIERQAVGDTKLEAHAQLNP